MTGHRDRNISNWTRKWANSVSLKHQYFESIDSTNTFAKTSRFSSFDYLILADHQTQGRGRGDHKWVDAGEGSFLLSSWVFEVDAPPQPILTARVGLQLSSSLIETWPNVPFSLKAPNDILVEGKKTAGLLVESLTDGVSHRLIVGLGLNVFSHPKVENSTCISDELGNVTEESWGIFLSKWQARLRKIAMSANETRLTPMEAKGILDALNRNSLLKEPYLSVEEDGTLITTKKTIPWFHL